MACSSCPLRNHQRSDAQFLPAQFTGLGVEVEMPRSCPEITTTRTERDLVLCTELETWRNRNAGGMTTEDGGKRKLPLTGSPVSDWPTAYSDVWSDNQLVGEWLHHPNVAVVELLTLISVHIVGKCENIELCYTYAIRQEQQERGCFVTGIHSEYGRSSSGAKHIPALRFHNNLLSGFSPLV